MRCFTVAEGEGLGRRQGVVRVQAAKQLHFNRDGEAMKRMQAGVDKLATVVGVTLGPKVSFEPTGPCECQADEGMVLHLSITSLLVGP